MGWRNRGMRSGGGPCDPPPPDFRWCYPASLPDADAVGGLHVHGVTLLHAPGVVPGVDVLDRAVGPEVGRRVRVGDDLLLDGVITVLGAPDLGEAEEEALVAGQAVDHRRRLAAQRKVIGVQSDQDAAEIA